jgi:hypothetical protein
MLTAAALLAAVLCPAPCVSQPQVSGVRPLRSPPIPFLPPVPHVPATAAAAVLRFGYTSLRALANGGRVPSSPPVPLVPAPPFGVCPFPGFQRRHTTSQNQYDS